MNKEFIFNAWAPEGALWSTWVKPVLFACMETPPLSEPEAPMPFDMSWVPGANENVALILDLPGAIGVDAGLALADLGYRPVPLYNAIPMPASPVRQAMVQAAPVMDELWNSARSAVTAAMAVVQVTSIMDSLWHGAIQRLQRVTLPLDAPPAFLLDSDRRGGEGSPGPGTFDNRSVSFTTDFPSAVFLVSHGIRRAVVIQPTGSEPKPDLAHTLRRWQEGGVAIELKRLDVQGAATPFLVPKPSWFGWAWQRVLAAAGLRRGNRGGFGNWVPEPGSGG